MKTYINEELAEYMEDLATSEEDFENMKRQYYKEFSTYVVENNEDDFSDEPF